MSEHPIELETPVNIHTVGEIKDRHERGGEWWYVVELAGGKRIELRQTEVEE